MLLFSHILCNNIKYQMTWKPPPVSKRYQNIYKRTTQSNCLVTKPRLESRACVTSLTAFKFKPLAMSNQTTAASLYAVPYTIHNKHHSLGALTNTYYGVNANFLFNHNTVNSDAQQDTHLNRIFKPKTKGQFWIFRSLYRTEISCVAKPQRRERGRGNTSVIRRQTSA